MSSPGFSKEYSAFHEGVAYNANEALEEEFIPSEFLSAAGMQRDNEYAQPDKVDIYVFNFYNDFEDDFEFDNLK